MPEFQWPAKARAALSFSWDDGRNSQLDFGLPLLDAYAVKATFYLNAPGAAARAADWKKASQNGHEIGNHTCAHPCSGNFEWVPEKDGLESYTLDKMEKDMLACSAALEKFSASPVRTFAYPCGQHVVGRGLEAKTTVPLVARHFLAGRAYRNEYLNDPRLCDLALLGAQEIDGLKFEEMRSLAERALKQGLWLVLAGHEMAHRGVQTTRLDELEKFLAWLQAPGRGLWVEPVAGVAQWLSARRKDPSGQKKIAARRPRSGNQKL